MSKLNIYRASAGSGKTYTLTREYLTLLFDEPSSYRNILAVTFTNKATDEMKSRILKEINLLAKGKKSGYADELREQFSLSVSELQQRAKDILQRLLHDYSRFSVTTIDSFFQKVVRSFTREIGLQMGYNIELDQGKVLGQVIDNLFVDLEEDKSLRAWLTRFAESKIQEGKSWSFKKDIFELGTEVFKEDFKSFDSVLIQKLSDKKFLAAYRSGLQKAKEEFETNFKQIGEKVRSILQQQGLSIEDFPYGKSGVGGYLATLEDRDPEPGKRVREAIDNPDKWYAKKASSELKVAIETAWSNGLNDLAKQAVEYYDDNYQYYNSIEKTINYIYTLGILTDISRKIQEYTNEENIFLLSDASRLLRDIIENNDTPFIFEKIGNVYQHFMIDEFQDTSRMQWDNFRPLVGNSLAEDQRSLVVGDVKQSIYRWRNGDWKLLSEQLDKDFHVMGTNALTLDSNWRSRKNVIDFNNAFYGVASQVLQEHYNGEISDNLQDTLEEEMEKIVNAYKDVYQNFPDNEKKKGGYICSEFLTNDEDEKWNEKVLAKLPSLVEQLQDMNYRAGDIAILVRKASEGRAVADALMAYKNSSAAKPGYNFDLISNDSLFVKNSPVVSFLVHILQYFVTPDNKINRAFLIQEYHRYIRQKDEIDLDELYNLSGELSNDFKSLLPDTFVNRIEELKRLPLYDMIEELIAMFDLQANSKDFPYLQAFQDLVLGFTKGETPDLASFLDWWEERKNKEVISVSDQQDAIRIMTIHKSKGLEFKAVLLPFCSWELDNNPLHSNILWCQPREEGFNMLDVLPVRYGTTLKDTIYYKEYFREQLQAFVDNINLLYVATTRAEEMLWTFSPKPSEKSKGLKGISDLMYFVYNNAQNFPASNAEPPIVQLSEGWNNEDQCFEWGELILQDAVSQEEEKLRMEEYPAHLLDERLVLKCHAGEYFDFSETESVDEIAPISRGNILHELFELIRYREDLDGALRKLQFEGKLDLEQANEVKIFAEKLLDREEIASWYSKDWKVINERDILLGRNSSQRPDRVIVKDDHAIVIDYKFGKKKSKSYRKQVLGYKELLTRMGFTRVEGYILYGKMGEVEKV
ncbi:MAG: UvrD-helicase domain-containing protein [Marinifilaceae bacterium]